MGWAPPQKKSSGAGQAYQPPPPCPQPKDPWSEFEPQAPVPSNPYAKPAATAQLNASGGGASGEATMGARPAGKSEGGATVTGGAPSGGGDPANVVSNGTQSPAQTQVPQFVGNMFSPRGAAPNNNDYNRNLTDQEYSERIRRAADYNPGFATAAPTLRQAFDQYGGPDAKMTVGGKESSPFDYLKRNAYADQGRYARLPGEEMKKWNSGGYKG